MVRMEVKEDSLPPVWPRMSENSVLMLKGGNLVSLDTH